MLNIDITGLFGYVTSVSMNIIMASALLMNGLRKINYG